MVGPYFPVAELANPVNMPGNIEAWGADQAQQLRSRRLGCGRSPRRHQGESVW